MVPKVEKFVKRAIPAAMLNTSITYENISINTL